MRVLLDECVPKRLAKYLQPHDVFTVTALGWSGRKNGMLLSSMEEAEISVLITVDKNLGYQQNIEKYQVAVLVLDAISNRFRDLLPFVPLTLDTLTTIIPGQVLNLQLE